MRRNDVKNELSPEESDVALVLEYYSQPFTIKTLAKSVSLTEEQVREILNNLGPARSCFEEADCRAWEDLFSGPARPEGPCQRHPGKPIVQTIT